MSRQRPPTLTLAWCLLAFVLLPVASSLAVALHVLADHHGDARLAVDHDHHGRDHHRRDHHGLDHHGRDHHGRDLDHHGEHARAIEDLLAHGHRHGEATPSHEHPPTWQPMPVVASAAGGERGRPHPRLEHDFRAAGEPPAGVVDRPPELALPPARSVSESLSLLSVLLI